MADPAAQIALIIGSLQRSQVSRYSNVASGCLFIYDYFVTLPDEIQLVWPGQWSPGKILFLVTRYMTWPELVLVFYQQTSDIPAAQCHSYFTYFAWSTLWGVAASELILILRTWALWDRKKVVVYGLIFLLVTLWIPNSYVISVVTKKTTFVASSTFSPALRGCFVTGSTTLVSISWILLMVMDFVILSLTVMRGIHHFRYRSSRLLVSLLRDGILYFVYLFSLSLANVVILYTTAPEYSILINQVLRVLHAMLSCRIILGLRGIAMEKDTQLLSSVGQLHGRSATTASMHNSSTWFGGGDDDTVIASRSYIK
ncbi:hypothetical protein EXIGLDRAFT_837630 [Exidia glandulosa HHB12029]|uniref:DUF6533 domain-containing protein n=1 Tax=Exidia glandulosa HHB12029 TaxID=1314781 RepID=A0A165GLA8_EXIGL|nr:hypothetical protein EXIGLDRAFT_837630 [Exidia glandulosa HHB12029]